MVVKILKDLFRAGEKIIPKLKCNNQEIEGK